MVQQSSDIGAAADAIVERLRQVAAVRPLDRARVESALAVHLQTLGLEARPVRWIEEADYVTSARMGFIEAWASLWQKGKPLSVGMTSTATFKAFRGPGLRRGGVEGNAERQEKEAGFGLKREARKTGERVGQRLTGAVDQASHRAELRNAARDALHEKGIFERTTMAQSLGSTPDIQRARQLGDLDREIYIGDAAHQAAIAAVWSARAHVLGSAGKPAEALETAAAAYLPLVDAVEAGLALFWVTEKDIIAVAAPSAG